MDSQCNAFHSFTSFLSVAHGCCLPRRLSDGDAVALCLVAHVAHGVLCLPKLGLHAGIVGALPGACRAACMFVGLPVVYGDAGSRQAAVGRLGHACPARTRRRFYPFGLIICPLRAARRALGAIPVG